MKRLWSVWIAAGLVWSLFFCSAALADWFQFQGENRNGISPEKGLLRSWPDEGPNVLWTFPLAAGYAGPAVRDGEVYVLDRVDEKQDILRCLDLETGKELWSYAYDAPGSTGHSGSRTVPSIDEKYVYTVGLMGDFVCVDRKTHQPVWHKNILKDFQTDSPRWGTAQSPVLLGDHVIVAPQSEDAFVAAYDRVSGAMVWKSESQGNLGYSPPVVTTLAGVEQVVMLGAFGQAAGLSPKDGKTLWTYDGWQCKIPIPYATTLPDDRLLITGGYGAGSVVIQIKREGETFSAQEIAKTDEWGSQIHQALLYDGYLYMNSNSNEREDGMACLTLDLELKWRTKDDESLPEFERGNLLLADDMIFNLDGKTGILHLIEPSPEGYRELARAKVLDGKKIWSPMALSNGKLIIRSQTEMKCLDVVGP